MLNHITIIGNCGTDPEMRYTPQGTPVTSLRMATTRTYGPADDRKQETEWFTIVCWDKLAEQVNERLKKGQRAYVEGRLHSNSFQGNDGQMKFRNEIVAARVLFLDRSTEATEQHADAPADNEPPW